MTMDQINWKSYFVFQLLCNLKRSKVNQYRVNFIPYCGTGIVQGDQCHCPKQVKIEGIPMPSHTNNSWPKSYKIKYSTHQSFLSNNLEIPESPWNSLSICRKENNFWIQLQVLLLKVEYFLRTVLKTEGVVWLAGLSLLRTFQQG